MFGSAVLALFYFGPVLEAQVILGLAILTYAAYSFLLVVEETAAPKTPRHRVRSKPVTA